MQTVIEKAAETYKAEWDAFLAIKEEFAGHFDRYAAFRAGEDSGSIAVSAERRPRLSLLQLAEKRNWSLSSLLLCANDLAASTRTGRIGGPRRWPADERAGHPHHPRSTANLVTRSTGAASLPIHLLHRFESQRPYFKPT